MKLLFIILVASSWGIGDSWYEGKHQGGGSGDDREVTATMPPPDPPAIIHHKDEVAINLGEAQAELQKLPPEQRPNFALGLPEFPNAKPGGKHAAFDSYEDNLELNLGIYGQALGGGIQGNTRAIFLGKI